MVDLTRLIHLAQRFSDRLLTNYKELTGGVDLIPVTLFAVLSLEDKVFSDELGP